jgi:Protein of unknown function (DUF1217)
VTYSPVIPLGGFSGWQFLNRTIEAQSAAMAATPAQSRDMDYFRENIGKIDSAEALVKDYRLLRVSLTAFGLQDDLPNKAFIQRILEDGTADDDALSNRLADKRYRTFSQAFGFGTDLPPLTRLPGFADKILDRFQDLSFELAVGEVNGDMRLALNAARELPEMAVDEGSEATLWFRVMGNTPLRTVLETAFGLPTSVGALDLDRQLEIFQDRADSVLGSDSVTQFSDPERVDDLIRIYLARSQLAQFNFATSSASIALTLLRGG